MRWGIAESKETRMNVVTFEHPAWMSCFKKNYTRATTNHKILAFYSRVAGSDNISENGPSDFDWKSKIQFVGSHDFLFHQSGLIAHLWYEWHPTTSISMRCKGHLWGDILWFYCAHLHLFGKGKQATWLTSSTRQWQFSWLKYLRSRTFPILTPRTQRYNQLLTLPRLGSEGKIVLSLTQDYSGILIYIACSTYKDTNVLTTFNLYLSLSCLWRRGGMTRAFVHSTGHCIVRIVNAGFLHE